MSRRHHADEGNEQGSAATVRRVPGSQSRSIWIIQSDVANTLYEMGCNLEKLGVEKVAETRLEQASAMQLKCLGAIIRTWPGLMTPLGLLYARSHREKMRESFCKKLCD